MERFGRRMPLIVGGLWQGAWLLVFASVGSTRDPTVDQGAAKVMIVSGCLCNSHTTDFVERVLTYAV